jgi:hypothetical protein
VRPHETSDSVPDDCSRRYFQAPRFSTILIGRSHPLDGSSAIVTSAAQAADLDRPSLEYYRNILKMTTNFQAQEPLPWPRPGSVSDSTEDLMANQFDPMETCEMQPSSNNDDESAVGHLNRASQQLHVRPAPFCILQITLETETKCCWQVFFEAIPLADLLREEPLMDEKDQPDLGQDLDAAMECLSSIIVQALEDFVQRSSGGHGIVGWPPEGPTYLMAMAIAVQHQHALLAEIEPMLQEWIRCFQPISADRRRLVWQEDGIVSVQPNDCDTMGGQQRECVCQLITLFLLCHTVWELLEKRDVSVVDQPGQELSLTLSWGVHSEWRTGIPMWRDGPARRGPRQWNEDEALAFMDEYAAYLQSEDTATACVARGFKTALKRVMDFPSDPSRENVSISVAEKPGDAFLSKNGFLPEPQVLEQPPRLIPLIRGFSKLLESDVWGALSSASAVFPRFRPWLVQELLMSYGELCKSDDSWERWWATYLLGLLSSHSLPLDMTAHIWIYLMEGQGSLGEASSGLLDGHILPDLCKGCGAALSESWWNDLARLLQASFLTHNPMATLLSEIVAMRASLTLDYRGGESCALLGSLASSGVTGGRGLELLLVRNCLAMEKLLAEWRGQVGSLWEQWGLSKAESSGSGESVASLVGSIGAKGMAEVILPSFHQSLVGWPSANDARSILLHRRRLLRQQVLGDILATQIKALLWRLPVSTPNLGESSQLLVPTIALALSETKFMAVSEGTSVGECIPGLEVESRPDGQTMVAGLAVATCSICPICECVNLGTGLLSLACGHSFHSTCLPEQACCICFSRNFPEF